MVYRGLNTFWELNKQMISVLFIVSGAQHSVVLEYGLFFAFLAIENNEY